MSAFSVEGTSYVSALSVEGRQNYVSVLPVEGD